MASHVVVIDSSFRRVTIKTTPGTYLSNILEEACSKFGLKAEQYGLKHGNKQVDLSRTIRLSNLSAGAKLNLVQASRSPSVISVALQLPTEGESSGSLARLTDKFPNNMSIWQILRRFESGVAGGESSNPRHNFTQRATPLVADNKSSGSGRLCYEMPVVNVMGRELGSFVDLQKTLGQLGFSSGSCLLRLNYRNTQQPLEEAMAEISKFFKEDEQHSAPSTAAPDPSQEVSAAATGVDVDVASRNTTENMATEEAQQPAAQIESENKPENNNTALPPTTSDPSRNTTFASSEISIFAAPSSATPAAASLARDSEADYVPTVAHAHLHQARLASETRNKKLLSDDEIAAQEQSRFETLSSVKEVVVRVRFPDETQAQKSFGRDATTSTLYAFCRELMNRPSGEGFCIRIFGAKGNSGTLQEDSRKLIQDLAWQGRVLVTVVWADNVSSETRRAPALKEQFRQQAEALRVNLQQSSGERDDEGKVVQTGGQKKQGSGIKQDVESKMRGFLKGLSKK